VRHRSQGTGEFRPEQLAACSADCAFERIHAEYGRAVAPLFSQLGPE
jgi:hypothetical protein